MLLLAIAVEATRKMNRRPVARQNQAVIPCTRLPVTGRHVRVGGDHRERSLVARGWEESKNRGYRRRRVCAANGDDAVDLPVSRPGLHRAR
jgi:hypothetical protein